MPEIYNNLKNLISKKKELKLNQIELIYDNLILNCELENIVDNIDILKDLLNLNLDN